MIMWINGKKKCDLGKKKLKHLEYCLPTVSEGSSMNWSLQLLRKIDCFTTITRQTSGPVRFSVFRIVFQKARPSCITSCPSPSVCKHGWGQHARKLAWAGLLTFALTGLGRLKKTPDHGCVSDRISCVNWWLSWDMLHWIWWISCSFQMKMSVLKWEKKRSQCFRLPHYFTFLFLLSNVAQAR